MVVEGMATALPFHRLVVRDPSFVEEPFRVHTRWIETEWAGQVPPYAAAAPATDADDERTTVVVEVGGKRLEVSLPAGFVAAGPVPTGRSAAPRRAARAGQAAATSGDTLASPMQGTIVKVAVAEGDPVTAGDLVVVLEAMKMEQPLAAHKDGVITGLTAEVGATVTSGAAICDIV
jgi:acetyl-CoA/propionyl-CoA carboxylase biotin carboxyl carrier protein